MDGNKNLKPPKEHPLPGVLLAGKKKGNKISAKKKGSKDDAKNKKAKAEYKDIPNRGRYHLDNRLNDLTTKEWLPFQKSWFIHRPKPRKKGVLLHPAKFPEELAEEFIRFFTKEGQTVLDPMAGTGSALVAALSAGRGAVGIELNPKYFEIARQRCDDILEKNALPFKMFNADAKKLDKLNLPPIDYCITSPPYWDMLHEDGFETQKGRKDAGLDVVYSDNQDDLGNIHDYEEFLDGICRVYEKVHGVLKEKGYLTVIVKNVKKKGKIYPLAWDIGKRLDGLYTLKDEKIWCQDDQKLAPYGYRYAWVSNTMHHYCLNFRKEE